MNSHVQEDDSLVGYGSSRGGHHGIFWYAAIVLFVLWNVLLFILAVVAIAKANEKSGTKGAAYTYAPISRSFVVGKGQTIPPETVVSLLPNGNIRIGAGTTVFNPTGTPPPLKTGSINVKMATFNPPFYGGFSFQQSELIVVVFTDASVSPAVTYASLGVLSLKADTISKWSEPKALGIPVTEALTVLSGQPLPNKKSFIVAGGGQLVVCVITNEDTLEFQVSPAQPYEGVSNAKLARLSDDTFVLAYYYISSIDNKQHFMNATVGTVTFNAQGLFESLGFTTRYNYATDRAYHTLFTFSATDFVIAYPSSDSIVINTTIPNSDTLITVRGSWNPTTKTLRWGLPTTLTSVKPSYFMTSVGLPTTTSNPTPKGVIVFIDAADNNAMKAVAVTAASGGLNTLSVRFGDIITIVPEAAGGSFEYGKQGVVPFISISAIDDEKMGLAFSDYGTDGKILTQILTLEGNNLRFQTPTPQYVISGANANWLLDYWWVNTAPLEINGQYGYVVLQYLQTGNVATDVINFAIVEQAPRPFGITSAHAPITQAGAAVDVVVNGVFRGLGINPFVPGRYYYSDTHGVMRLRDGNLPSDQYVISNKTLLSLESRVGVAISTTEILLVNDLAEIN